MSSDVIWHIRDKLWPMPKHGSIRKVYACLAVTCHLHFWQNDRDFLRATVVTRGWNGYRNKSQHRKSTLEKKILPPFQQGFEPATFQSRVRRSNHWAIPAPRLEFGKSAALKDHQASLVYRDAYRTSHNSTIPSFLHRTCIDRSEAASYFGTKAELLRYFPHTQTQRHTLSLSLSCLTLFAAKISLKVRLFLWVFK